MVVLIINNWFSIVYLKSFDIALCNPKLQFSINIYRRFKFNMAFNYLFTINIINGCI